MKLRNFLVKFRANYVRSAKILNFEAVVQLNDNFEAVVQLNDEIQNHVDKHEVIFCFYLHYIEFIFWNKD